MTHASPRSAHPRPPYRVGEQVFGISCDPRTGGTVGGLGAVMGCTQRPDSGWNLRVRFATRTETYHLSRSGHSDYVGRPTRPTASAAPEATR